MNVVTEEYIGRYFVTIDGTHGKFMAFMISIQAQGIILIAHMPIPR